MKRFSMVGIAPLSLAFLSFAFTAHPAAAATCTPNWRVAQSATIYQMPPIITHPPIGNISLLRDGCGNIQASLTIDVIFHHGVYSLNDANTNTTIWSGLTPYPATVPYTQTSPVFAGYGGIGIFAKGSVFQGGTGGTATTAIDFGN